jgi:hypothetical protein
MRGGMNLNKIKKLINIKKLIYEKKDTLESQ